MSVKHTWRTVIWSKSGSNQEMLGLNSAASWLNPGRIEREGIKKGEEGKEINKLTLQHLVSTYYKREYLMR